MAQAVVYLRPGASPARREACVAAAGQRGLTVQYVTSDPAEARRLRDAGCVLITEFVSDVLPDVVVPPPRRPGRGVAPVVVAAGASTLLARLWQHKATTGAVAAGTLAAATGLLLLPDVEPHQPSERPPAVAPAPAQSPAAGPRLERGTPPPGQPPSPAPIPAPPVATSPAVVRAEGPAPPPAVSSPEPPPPPEATAPPAAVVESPPVAPPVGVPPPTVPPLDPPPLPEVDIGEEDEEDDEGEEDEEDCVLELKTPALDIRICPPGPDG